MKSSQFSKALKRNSWGGRGKKKKKKPQIPQQHKPKSSVPSRGPVPRVLGTLQLRENRTPRAGSESGSRGQRSSGRAGAAPRALLLRDANTRGTKGGTSAGCPTKGRGSPTAQPGARLGVAEVGSGAAPLRPRGAQQHRAGPGWVRHNNWEKLSGNNARAPWAGQHAPGPGTGHRGVPPAPAVPSRGCPCSPRSPDSSVGAGPHRLQVPVAVPHFPEGLGDVLPVKAVLGGGHGAAAPAGTRDKEPGPGEAGAAGAAEPGCGEGPGLGERRLPPPPRAPPAGGPVARPAPPPAGLRPAPGGTGTWGCAPGGTGLRGDRGVPPASARSTRGRGSRCRGSRCLHKSLLRS